MDADRSTPIAVGLDDGYAQTKLALPGGRLLAIPSRGRIGRAKVTALNGSAARTFEYETEGTTYTVGAIDGEPTSFEDYPCSGLNRVIVQHALQQAGLAGRSLHAVSGLPIAVFYGADGARRVGAIERKCASLRIAVAPGDGRPAAAFAFHEVIPEALAAWYDHVITETPDGGVRLEAERIDAPIAIVDIGGRTTDLVVIAEQAVHHPASGSLRCGLLDVKRQVADAIRDRFDEEEISERLIEEAMQSGRIRLYGASHEVGAILRAARGEILARIRTEVARRLGRGAELERVLFVGGGTLALAADLGHWFPNQLIAPHAAFANARGMLKYLQYVCEELRRD